MITRLTHRLLALVCLPLIALFGLTWWKLSDNMDLHQVVETMTRNASFFSTTSALIQSLQDTRSSTLWQDQKQKLDGFTQTLGNSQVSPEAKAQAQEHIRKISEDIQNQNWHRIEDHIRYLIELEAEVASARTTKGIGKIFNSLVIVEFSRENLDLMSLEMLKALRSGHKPDSVTIERFFRYRSQVDGLLSPALILSTEAESKLIAARKMKSWMLLDGLAQKFMERQALSQKDFPLDHVQKAADEQVALISEVLAQELRGIDRKLDNLAVTNKQESWMQILIFLAVFILVVIFNSLIAKGVHDSIAKLRTFASNLGSGDLTHRLRSARKDELGQLAHALDQMADKLQESEKKLRDQQASLLLNSKMSALGEMAGGVAHEINTPLSIIQINSNMIVELLQKPNPEIAKIQKLGDSLDVTCQRITKIVRSLLIFSRHGTQEDVRTTSVSEIINDTFALCHSKFKNNETELNLEPVATDLSIECNRIQISQVLLNLLNNAFDAVSGQDVRNVRVSVHNGDESVDIAVTDSGPGIAKDLREKIMLPFFTTKKIGHGTGLGLSVSKGLVEDHGGRLFLDTDSPQTRFVIHLPKHYQAEHSELQIKEAT